MNLIEYKYLNEFIDKYPDYNLLETLTYNSYAVKGSRDSHRERDSISTTEMLGLINDCNLELVKRFHGDKMKEACLYGTKQHGMIENHILNGIQGDSDVFKNYRLFTIKHGVTDMLSEKEYKIIYNDIPPITGTIDCECTIDGKRYIVDWKTSKSIRSFISTKHKLQIAMYSILSGIDNGAVVYLNSKGYEFKEVDNLEYYKLIVRDLIKYTRELFKNNKINNLLIK